MSNKSFADVAIVAQCDAQIGANQFAKFIWVVCKFGFKKFALDFEPIAKFVGGVAVVHVVRSKLAKDGNVAFVAEIGSIYRLQPLLIKHNAEAAIGHQVGSIELVQLFKFLNGV